MLILKKYIFQGWLKSFITSLAIFTLILSIGNLVKVVELIINKGVKPLLVLQLFLYVLPYSLVYTVPISSLISTLLVFARLSADNEIVALKASGISLQAIAIPFLFSGLILSLITLIFNDKLLPYAHYASRQLIFKIGKQNPTAYLEPGTFIKAFKDHILFFYAMKGNELKDVRIYVTKKGRPLRTIIAKKAHLKAKPGSHSIELILYNGTSDEIDPQDPSHLYKLDFKVYSLTLNLTASSQSKLDKKAVELTIEELKSNIESLKQKGIDAIELISEIHKRYALSFSCFLFIMMGLPLGIQTRRKEKSIGYGLGLLIIVIYYAIMITSETMVLHKKLPVIVGHWSANILFSFPALFLFLKVNRIK